MTHAPRQYRPLCHWVPTHGHHIPHHAVHGGVDSSGETLYIGRAKHHHDIVPGKVVPSHSCCYVPHNGRENVHREYDILVAQHESEFAWEHAANGRLPAGAVQGGMAHCGEALFIGRVYHNGSLTIGSIHPSRGHCTIPYGGGVFHYSQYEVLVCKIIRLDY